MRATILLVCSATTPAPNVMQVKLITVLTAQPAEYSSTWINAFAPTVSLKYLTIGTVTRVSYRAPPVQLTRVTARSALRT